MGKRKQRKQYEELQQSIGDKKKFLYVTGDSFCAQRYNNNHWPKILADKLGLELLGQGYPGYGWWPSCQDFVSKFDLDSASGDLLMDRTPIFIFCHTDIHRPITGNRSWLEDGGPAQHSERMEFHLKYIADAAADNWCAERWYKQIGEVLSKSDHDKKTVIHLNCFPNNQHLTKFLKGKVFRTPLIDIATVSAGGTVWGNRSKELIHKINNTDNHFSGDYNQRFAHFLYENMFNNVVDIEL